MSKATIYHNPRCGKSRQTLAILEEKGISHYVIQYLKKPLSKEELSEIIELLDIRPQALIRKGEKVFKEEFKGKEFSDEEWIEAMVTHPILIERPIVINNGKAVIGRPPENVLSII